MTSEFVSKLEEIMKAEELDFEPTPGFGRWKPFFPDEAVKHPAKANLNLIEFLIKQFTREDDIVLDPMCGTSSTCILASLMGRDSICIDIEEKFVEWGLEAKKRVENAPVLGRKGKMVVIHGDARELSKILTQIDIDAIVTSPPYEGVDNVKKNSEEFWIKMKELGLRWGSKPPAGTAEKLYSSRNIGSLSHEEYLVAMFKVYREMCKVLKPNGLAIVIIKPFIRNKRVVDLPYYTYLLMRRAGFKLEKLYKLRLKQESFWRILYYRKYPNVPRIAHEYILVCRKNV